MSIKKPQLHRLFSLLAPRQCDPLMAGWRFLPHGLSSRSNHPPWCPRSQAHGGSSVHPFGVPAGRSASVGGRGMMLWKPFRFSSRAWATGAGLLKLNLGFFPELSREWSSEGQSGKACPAWLQASKRGLSVPSGATQPGSFQPCDRVRQAWAGRGREGGGIQGGRPEVALSPPLSSVFPLVR